MNFFKLYIGDYQRDTGALSVAEHGVYLLMLQHFYATEKPLPNGRDLYRLLRCETKTERAAVDSVVVRFWVETEGGLINTRAMQEFDRAAEISETNRAIALAREAKKRTRQEHEQSTNRVQSVPRTCHEQSTNQTPDTRLIESNANALLVGNDADEHPAKGKIQIPPCPHQVIVDLYGEVLPEQPQPRSWEGRRADNLRARWKWVLTAKKRDGRRYAETVDEAVDFFRRMFWYMRGSDYLMKKWMNWDLGWIVKADNFEKILAGNYDNNREAA